MQIFEKEDVISAIWGTAEDDIFVGGHTRIYHYNGIEWSEKKIYPSRQVEHLWGSGHDDVYAAAIELLHYDGTSWSVLSGVPAPMGDIWGNSTHDVYQVGGTSVFRYDGNSWMEMGLPVSDADSHYLEGIWGSSGEDLFVVGWDYVAADYPVVGRILHYDGQSWTEEVRNSSRFLDVWGNTGSDVFVVGEYGEVFHFDGSAWTDMGLMIGGGFNGVWGNSGSNVFAVGSKMFHFDGHDWSEMECGRYYLLGVWGCSDTDVYAVGCKLVDDGNDIFCGDGVILRNTCSIDEMLR